MNLLKSIEQRIEETFLELEAKRRLTYTRPRLELFTQGTTSAWANYRQWTIGVNTLLARANVEDFLTNTIPHEVAHLATDKEFGPGTKAHGREWKFIMLELGLEPTRCHNYNTALAARGNNSTQAKDARRANHLQDLKELFEL